MSTPVHRTAPGVSYFVTTRCWQGRAVFQVREIAEILVQTIFDYRDSGAYLLHEFVIMPDHLHLLLTPGRETSLEKAIQLIKGGSSHRIHKARGQKMEIWQLGFHDWTIRDSEDWYAKVGYIQMNPVRARLVAEPQDWAYSSASGRFKLDPVPEKYLHLASGAKAPEMTKRVAQGLKPVVGRLSIVGPEGPTPGALTEHTTTSGAKAQDRSVTSAPGLMSPPPEEPEPRAIAQSRKEPTT